LTRRAALHETSCSGGRTLVVAERRTGTAAHASGLILLYISVVIAARDEATLLPRCLDAAMKQVCPAKYEVVVVDNASCDATQAIARSYDCRFVYEPRQGQLYAKRRGVAEAHGDVVVMLDADCVPPPGWLKSIHDVFSNDAGRRVVAITCAYKFEPPIPWWGRGYVFAVHAGLVRVLQLCFRSMPYVVGGNVAFLKRAYDRGGGYRVCGGIGETELGLAQSLSRSGTVKYVDNMQVVSSSRRFHSGPWHFFVRYKLVEYWIRYLKGRSLRAWRTRRDKFRFRD
jgi:glycosyltransferase involved in cell wall biosynthesis